MMKMATALVSILLIFSVACGVDWGNYSNEMESDALKTTEKDSTDETDEPTLSDTSNEDDIDLLTMSIEEAVDFAIEKVRADKEKVIITEHFGTEDEDDVIVSIYLSGLDGISTKMLRDAMFSDAQTILECLQVRDDIGRIALFFSQPLIDSYGNVEDKTVIKIQLEKETFQKINFEYFNRNKFPDIADDYYEHAIFKD